MKNCFFNIFFLFCLSQSFSTSASFTTEDNDCLLEVITMITKGKTKRLKDTLNKNPKILSELLPKKNCPLLDWAFSCNKPEIVKCLLKEGVYIENDIYFIYKYLFQDPYEEGTPEKEKWIECKAELIKIFKEHGLDLNKTTEEGSHAIHFAIQYCTRKNMGWVDLLLDEGQSLESVNKMGETPINILFSRIVGYGQGFCVNRKINNIDITAFTDRVGYVRNLQEVAEFGYALLTKMGKEEDKKKMTEIVQRETIIRKKGDLILSGLMRKNSNGTVIHGICTLIISFMFLKQYK